MTGAEFSTFVKVKLDRIDSSFNSDVRTEEILFFAREALKKLILTFDVGSYGRTTDKGVLYAYSGNIVKQSPEIPLTNNQVALPSNILKIKGVSVYVTTTMSGTTYADWVSARETDTNEIKDVQGNPFTQSFPDNPAYRLMSNKIVFDAPSFSCIKTKYEFLQYPSEITEESTLDFPFMEELEDTTVTLILENLESRRLQSQPAVSKS